MKKHLTGFMKFVREQGVVGMAVGLAIGAAAGTAVKSIVDNFISPIVGFILGGAELENLRWTIVSNPDRQLIIGWGAIVSSVITLLATAFVVYQLVHTAKLDKMDKKSEEK